MHSSPSRFYFSRLALAIAFVLSAATAFAQDNPLAQIEQNSGVSKIRLAAADFKATSAGESETAVDKRVFDTTLFNDLQNAGIFDLVSKSTIPLASPGFPAEINLSQWASAPANAAFVAFGNFSVQSGRLVVNGFLDDAKNTQFPQVFAKQYNEEASEDQARQIAHRFADEIIYRLGGGTPGIAESKIFYIKMTGGGNKEVWEMDYDGANQHAITHLGSDSISPRVSPDNSRIAFSTLGKIGFQLHMYSMLLGRDITFPGSAGSNISPAWSSDGRQLAFSSSRDGRNNIWVSDPDGRLAHKITNYGSDVSPTWNPRTNAQIAFISGRSRLPQLYMMDSDGSAIQRLTDGGYVSSPSWSSNGQFIAFAWDRKYGPGAPGGQDIYIISTVPKTDGTYPWIQLTHDQGACDFPTWSPDGRHITYANGRGANTRIMTMLFDGTLNHPLTGAGADMPNWSWK